MTFQCPCGQASFKQPDDLLHHWTWQHGVAWAAKYRSVIGFKEEL